MQRFLRFILLKPVLWAAAKLSSRPDKGRIFEALTVLYQSLKNESGKKGLVIPFEQNTGKIIIFSDMHKGARNGADDFMQAETNYLAALAYYRKNDFTFISLGDSEELWENNIFQVKKKNKASFEAEKKFIAHSNFIKIFGNHDLFWDNDPLAAWHLKHIYETNVKVYEGVILLVNIGDKTLNIYCTHGHQGDKQSDGNWFSKFFVANIWASLQSLLKVNPNTPAYDAEKKTIHNSIMYEWSAAQQDILLITGHTHQPVFQSLTHIEKLYKDFQMAEKVNNNEKIADLLSEIKKREKEFSAVSVDYMKMKPSYFNSGCCCFSDGDITGIEIAEGYIRLIKWSGVKGRQILEQRKLEELVAEIIN